MTSQKESLKMILTLLMIVSCPWIAMGGTHNRIQRQHLEKNSINSVSSRGSFDSAGADSDWIKIYAGLPNSMVVKAGETLELECEVLGSPPPTVKWLKDGKLIYPQDVEEYGNNLPQGLFGALVEEEEEENNDLPGEAEILRSLNGGRAKVVSRLRIPCVTPKHQGVYMCLGNIPTSVQISNHLEEQVNSFPQTAMSSTVVHVQGRRVDFLSGSCARKMRGEAAWVREWWPVVMQVMGKGIVLSCTAGGQPQPRVSWLDSSNKPISSGNSIDTRRRVLPTGELYISDLRWEDMGGYTCIVRNSLGKSSETTFLYPLRSEEQS
ncbi:hypothetical protein J437_LFUL016322 [Ladona fulva]|uniref:Ig-like domain-containing protein n=1 Tax=Ladona fulva TaxID=123851 RepID=A0A8K0KI65_LADFU|nr:hypothetical protein J437_LFUL016322 [Ladona fulva]